jgi:lipoprotein-releasing system permease protein
VRIPDDYKPVGRQSRILLFLTAWLWSPVYLLFQAVGICGDGLYQILFHGRRQLGSDRLSIGTRVVLGFPGLVVFPLIIGLRGLVGLILSLGVTTRTLGQLPLLRSPWLNLVVPVLFSGSAFLLFLRSPTLVTNLQALGDALFAPPGRANPLYRLSGYSTTIEGLAYALIIGCLLTLLWISFWFLVRRLPANSASHFCLGILLVLLAPCWLGPALVFGFLPWLIWQLLIPEFARAMRRGGSSESRFIRFIGLRYLFGKRETILHSATSYFAAGGIALGVCALIVVLAVMSGFDREVKARIVGTNAHVILLRFGTGGLADADSLCVEVAKHPEVVATAPFVYGTAMLTAGDAAEGAVVEGIEWDQAHETTSLGKYIRDFDGTNPFTAGDGALPRIILGRHIATNMSLIPGDEMLVVSPAGAKRSPLGFIPRMRKFVVGGIFDSGMYDFDATMCFVALPEAQSFFGLGDQVTGIEVRISEMYDAQRVGEELVQQLGGFPMRANNWIDLNANLFQWMRTEKQMMFIILTMIILVAGFNIASSLIMLVMEKRREIGILKSMGASPMSILRIFVLEGWVMAFSGTALGAATGLLLCYVIKNYRLIRLPEGLYFIDTLPINVEVADVAAIIGSVLIISILSTLYPAWKASRLDAIEAIHSE